MHKVCIDCKWENYPECHAKIDWDGNYEKIDNLSPQFNCVGIKEGNVVYDDSKYKNQKTPDQLKIEELEARISKIEK